MLPTFLIIGTTKGGTTSLDQYLGAHPDVFMVSPKEPNFFANKWDCGLEWYEHLFDAAGSARARGEASPNYSSAPRYGPVPERIASIVPDMKLIYLVREPVARIRSDYAMRVDEGHDTRPFVEAIHDELEYLNPSRYGYQLDQYLAYFDREQILILNSDYLRLHREEALADVCTFIGVEPAPVVNLDASFNSASDRTREFGPGRRLRNGLDRIGLRERIPASWRSAARRLIIDRPAEPPDMTLSESDEEALRASFDGDLKRLREIVGPDFSLWDRA